MNDKDSLGIWKRRFELDKGPSNTENFYMAFQNAEKAVNNKDSSNAKKFYLEARGYYIGFGNEDKQEVYQELSALYGKLIQLIKEERLISDLTVNKHKLPKLVKYSIPVVLILLIITSLLLLKPSTTGYVVLGKETIYNKTLNLKINESGNYTWVLDKQGTLKSIMASGSFSGNGTVKIYIEKDGKKYLIFDNKKQ